MRPMTMRTVLVAALLFAATGTLLALLWYLPLARATMRGRTSNE